MKSWVTPEIVYADVISQLKRERNLLADAARLRDVGEQLVVGWDFVNERFGKTARAAVHQFWALRWPSRHLRNPPPW